MRLTAGKPILLHWRKRRGGSGNCFIVEFIQINIRTARKVNVEIDSGSEFGMTGLGSVVSLRRAQSDNYDFRLRMFC